MQVQEDRATPATSLLDHLWEKKILDWPPIALEIKKLALPVESLPQSFCSFSGPDSGRGHYWHLVSLGHKKGSQETPYQLHTGSVRLHTKMDMAYTGSSQEEGSPAYVMT